MKTIEDILSVNGKQDNKHKKNANSDKKIPFSLLDDIDEGITSEKIEELIDDGYNIYRYFTQITLHGICNNFSNDRFGYYKNINLNKNGSLGIKWNAIDINKKKRIGQILKYFNFGYCRDSKGDTYTMSKRVDDGNYMTILNEFKNIINRVNKDIFFGNMYIQKINLYGHVNIYFTIYLNGILEKNINEFIEQILNLNIDEINKIIKIKEDEKLKSSIEFDNKMKEEREKRIEKEKEDNLIFENTILKDYKIIDFKDISVNSIFYYKKRDMYGNLFLEGYIKKNNYSKAIKEGEKGTRLFHQYKRVIYSKNNDFKAI